MKIEGSAVEGPVHELEAEDRSADDSMDAGYVLLKQTMRTRKRRKHLQL